MNVSYGFFLPFFVTVFYISPVFPKVTSIFYVISAMPFTASIAMCLKSLIIFSWTDKAFFIIAYKVGSFCNYKCLMYKVIILWVPVLIKRWWTAWDKSPVPAPAYSLNPLNIPQA